MKNKKSREMDGALRSSAKAKKRTNKHNSYMKIQERLESGKHVISGVEGEDVFYCGTYDGDLTNNIVDQVFNANIYGEKLTERGIKRINATLAAILETDPQDATELMLATQMATVHNAVMSLSGRALKDGQSIELASFYINGIAKLMRTYTTQMDALNKYRTKGKQQITVKHQHVNVNDGGQAIVGDVKGGGQWVNG